jgi:competence protein ComEA
MSDLPRTHLIAYALAAVLVIGLGVRQVAHSRAAETPVAAAGTARATVEVDGAAGGSAGSGSSRGGTVVVVHVAGAVRRPGVYRMRSGARVDDAVRRAGGARRRADLTQLNLAAKLEDGKQVLVPERAPSAGAAAAGTATGVAAAPTTPGVPLNLNTATLEQLDTLSGVGPATAQKILDYREQHSGFSSVEELGQVPGIGEVRLAALRELVRV